MPRLFLFLVLNFFIVQIGHAQLGWEWGAINDTGVYPATAMPHIAIDNAANMFTASITSTYNDSTMFGSHTVYNYDHLQQLIITKSDSSGHFLWAIGTHGSDAMALSNMHTDAAGNLYVYGMYDDTVLTIGADTLRGTPNSYTYFITKISPSGSVVWAKNVCRVLIPTYVFNMFFWGNMDMDAAGNIYVTGVYRDYSVTIGSTTLYNAGGTGLNSFNTFMARFDNAGNAIWAKTIGNLDNTYPCGLSVTKPGDIFLFGDYNNTLPLTIGSVTLTDSQHYLARFDNSGNLKWAKNLSSYIFGNSTSFPDGGISMILDNKDNIYMAGGMVAHSVVPFGRDTVTTPLFIARYDSSGNPVWGKGISGDLYDNGFNNITIDDSGKLWIYGRMNTAGPTAGYVLNIDGNTFTEPALCASPTFITSFDTAGNYIHSMVLDAGAYGGIIADHAGSFYISGSFGYVYGMTMDFGPDTLRNNSGTGHFIIAKYHYRIINETTGAESAANSEPGIILYPNPASDELNIVATQDINTITLSDMYGKTIFSDQHAAGRKVSIHTSALPVGVYIVQVNGWVCRKFVKE